jgi:hypothetical protein
MCFVLYNVLLLPRIVMEFGGGEVAEAGARQ